VQPQEKVTKLPVRTDMTVAAAKAALLSFFSDHAAVRVHGFDDCCARYSTLRTGRSKRRT
jgi:hypothetical protein